MAWPLKATKRLTHDDYTVAWICALPIEKTAARNMLDELHLTPPQPDHDKNIYTFGSICGHNVVIVCQGDMGTTAAAVVATRMEATFRRLRFGLLVGIAGGVPDEKDIRLGDVVVSKGDGRFGGVVAHDRGKETSSGFESRPFLDGIPELLRNAFSELESLLMDHDSKAAGYISQAVARNSRFLAFDHPETLVDNLYEYDYLHSNSRDKTCVECDKTRLIQRKTRYSPLVHFGIVASGNQVIKDGVERRKILQAHPGTIAVEMEAAGLMNVFGCSTIRGICDYADSHKNDGWHRYASAMAAAAAKEVLSIIPPPTVVAAPAISMAGSYALYLRVKFLRWQRLKLFQVSMHTADLYPASAASPEFAFMVPFPRDRKFVGREDILCQIEERLQTQRRVSLAGIGGVGYDLSSLFSYFKSQCLKIVLANLRLLSSSHTGSVRDIHKAMSSGCLQQITQDLTRHIRKLVLNSIFQVEMIQRPTS